MNINYVLLSLILLRVQQVSPLQKHQCFSAGAGKKSLEVFTFVTQMSLLFIYSSVSLGGVNRSEYCGIPHLEC